MVDKPVELVARLSGRGTVHIDEVRDDLPEGADAKKALFRLGQLGFVFRIAQGTYAVPGKEELSDALALRGRPVRLAAWLHRWFRRENEPALPSGLDWPQASFVGLSLHMHSELRWEGPDLLVPIEDDAQRIQGLHHSVSIFAFDPVNEPIDIELKTIPTLLPDPDDLARVLSVHQDPRLQEAGQRLRDEEGGGDDEFDVWLARTDPPVPFTDARLPEGPPFRYRLFAPRSWVRENVEHAHPGRGPSEEDA